MNDMWVKVACIGVMAVGGLVFGIVLGCTLLGLYELGNFVWQMLSLGYGK
jgi:hypothetical protein